MVGDGRGRLLISSSPGGSESLTLILGSALDVRRAIIIVLHAGGRVGIRNPLGVFGYVFGYFPVGGRSKCFPFRGVRRGGEVAADEAKGRDRWMIGYLG